MGFFEFLKKYFKIKIIITTMSSHINKRISFFQKIIIFLIIGILIFILFVWYSDFSINHGYSLLETPMVRSCQVDSDCQ